MNKELIRIYIMVLILGIFSALINSANGILAGHLGLLESVLIVHIIGLFMSTIYYIFLDKNKKKSLLAIAKKKPYLMLGGFVGYFAVVSISFSVQHIGVFLVSTALVAGQFICSFFIDVNGLFGFEKIPLSKRKILSITVMLIGITLLSI